MHTSMMMTVNSPPVPHRDLSGSSTSTYRPYNEEYASVQRRIERPAEVEAERSKKEKKWSIGKLFRRKKKDEDSGSSSQSDDVSGLSPSKKKSKKKKRAPLVNNFDHIVIRDTRRAQSLAKPIRDDKDDGVLSDPSADFHHHKSKTQGTYEPKDYLDLRHDISRVSTTVLETPAKKKRKSRLKARVEALRNSVRGESSSDEESLKSSNSSSIIRFRSEDSLMRSRDSSLNKKSRSARNERYIKRLSRDDENQLNKEAELLQQGYTKAEVELLTRTPTSQSSGYGTCKREHHNNIKSDQLIINDSQKGPMKSESVSSFPSTQSYLSSINFNAKVNNDHINYSIQCASNNSNSDSLYANNQREGSLSNQYENPENILCVKFPLGNVPYPTKKEERAPPVPPPRDMQRKVVTPISMYYENNPMIADRISNNHNALHGVLNNDFERIMRRSQERSYGTSGLRRPISTSEDHIAMQNNEYTQYHLQTNDQPRRPASVSAEPNHYGIFSNNTPPWRKRTEPPCVKPEPTPIKQDYLYYADHSPRSRRPISIKNGLTPNQYLSDSQNSFNVTDSVYKRPRNASDFWKKIDDAERLRQQQGIFANSRSGSENNQNAMMYRSYSERAKPTNKLYQSRAESVDSCNRNKSFDVMDGAKIWKATTEYKQSETKESPKSDLSPTKTHVRHKSDTFLTGNNQTISDDEKNSERRKSTNLDDALNELEAIYNSLGLGDEDLLDRAERRELMTPKFKEQFNDWNGNDNNVQLRSQPTTPLRRISRRSTLPDKLQDDMAFRRMNSFSNKEKPNLKEAQAQISYMLASPAYVPYASDDDKNSERNEPDIVHDDVVYRNIKQTNNRLKTIDPQPPFGIPVGPISPAPQSDYLHATPENKGRSRFIPKRSPDIVADDLAYRSLRKDNRNSSLFNGEDYNGLVNNNTYTEFPFNKESVSNMKKKRAVRSLSANIFTMIQKEIDDAINMTKMPTLQKTNSNSDVMKRLRETFEHNDNSSRDHFHRNKVKQRHNTVNLFVNNTPTTPSHNFTRDDSFIHADDTCLAKPSPCEKSKNSSPLNKSPQISKRSSKDEFQHVLSMLAQEAMDTSNKLGVALAELDKNRNKNDTLNVQNKISNSRQEFLNGLTEKSFNNNESDTVDIDYAMKKDQQTTNNTENETRAKSTEDSLLLISGQINKVEEQLKSNVERDDDLKIKDTSKYPEKYSWSASLNKTNDLSIENKTVSDMNSKSFFEPSNSINSFLENKHEEKSQMPVPKINSSNPFINNDEIVKELNEIKAFKELKDGIKDLIAGISEVNDKLFINKKAYNEEDSQNKNPKYDFKENHDEKEMQIAHCASKKDNNKRTSFTPSIYENCVKKDEADSTEYNSSEELATIFKFDVPAPPNENKPENNENKQEKREDLNSPKLVKTMSQQLRRLSVDEGTSSQSTPLSTNVVPWRVKKHNSQSDAKGSNQKPKRWHDSGTLMLACSYTLMFSQHLADLDWLTLLGLLLAIVTIIAMLMI